MCEIGSVLLVDQRAEAISECGIHCFEILVALLGVFPLCLEVEHLGRCPCRVDVEDGSRVLWVLRIVVLTVGTPDDLWKTCEQ